MKNLYAICFGIYLIRKDNARSMRNILQSSLKNPKKILISEGQIAEFFFVYLIKKY